MLALAIVLAQSQPTTEAQVFGPILGYFMASGVAGIVIVLAMLGKIDLRPSTTQAQLAEYKKLNADLLKAGAEQIEVSNATVAGLQAMTAEVAATRTELTALRIELARRGSP